MNIPQRPALQPLRLRPCQALDSLARGESRAGWSLSRVHMGYHGIEWETMTRKSSRKSFQQILV
ncbi:MAG: hypothetical protein ACKODL_08045 [Phenylobacterium sp.]